MTSVAVGLREGVEIRVDGDDVVLVDDDRAAFRLSDVDASLLDALRALPLDARLAQAVQPLLATYLLLDGTPLLSIEATSGARYEPAVVDTAVRLSKFAMIRRRNEQLVLESPTAVHRAVLSDPRVRALVADLAVPRVVDDGDLGRDVVAHLAAAGLLDVADPDGRFAADADPDLRQWEPADLLLHTRSRIGGSDEPLGGRFSHYDTIEPLPALKALPGGPLVPLPRPVLGAVLDRDPALVTAMEARQSVRTFGADPLALPQLAEFLYRVARVRSTYGPRPERGMPYEASSRPYPCGGAEYELELYLTVARCEGLMPASYYYDPAGHRLVRLPTSDDDRSALLDLACTSTGGQALPDVLVTVTSRFARTSWKYRAIAYALTLRHVGALYQSMYLVATAMKLGGCALGTGDSRLAARAFGLDPLAESSVGDFVLGSLPDGLAHPEDEADRRPFNDPQWQAESRSRLSG